MQSSNIEVMGCFVLLLLLILMGCSSVSAQWAFSRCSPSNYTSESYRESIREVTSALIHNSSLSLFHNLSSKGSDAASSSSTIYGMYQCRADISLQACFACVNQSLTAAAPQSCPNNVGAHIFMELCHARYDNRSGLFDGTAPDMESWYSVISSNETLDPLFLSYVQTRLMDVTSIAASKPNLYAYIVPPAGSVYAQAQCDTYLSKDQCLRCFGDLAKYKDYLNGSRGGRVHFGSCFYRYANYLFFNIPSPPPPSSKPPNVEASLPSPSNDREDSLVALGATFGGLISSIVFFGLFVCLLFIYYKIKKKSQALRLYEELIPFHHSATIYSYNELRVATQDFHPHNKLGQGGFGPVYKGTLSDGQEVAIKKLSIGSNQGKREFTNEVTIITSVQHINLIKLYGCCIEGRERLLVYEYLPKKSLDMHIFDKEDVNDTKIVLDWKTRVEIIQGIARGLAYLHEDSQVHIIHRDIKPGNILLDKDLMPKIADFGLARLFNNDIDHVTTTVAGTIGYLSPEYVLHGQLTEKVDIFSFGVVTLEIVSGRRNIDYNQPQEKQNLLEWAWKCYKEEEHYLQLLDPRLINLMTPLTTEEEDELARVITMAIWCTQSSAIDRPSMSNVRQLLARKYDNLDVPSNYPFSITTTTDDLNNIMDTTSSALSTHHSSHNSCSGSRQVSNVTVR